jgi:hypothetical protein
VSGDKSLALKTPLLSMLISCDLQIIREVTFYHQNSIQQLWGVKSVASK